VCHSANEAELCNCTVTLTATVGLVGWCSGNAFDPINEVTVRLWAGKSSRYVTSRLGQLSLASLRGI